MPVAAARSKSLMLLAGSVGRRVLEVRGERHLRGEVDAVAALGEADAVAAVERNGPWRLGP